MSFQTMTWAVRQQCGSAATKLVLLMLANHANGHTGQCNPRHKILAEECEMRVEALKVHLKKLADSGLIDIIPVFIDGVQLPNHYRLNDQGGGGENRMGGGGENRMGGGGENRTPYNQEGNQEGNQEAPRKRSARQASPASAVLGIQDLKKEGIDEQQAADWLKVRKAKRLPLTSSAWDGIKHEIAKACISIPDAIRECNKRGWGSFMADWYAKDGAGKNGDNQDEIRALFARAE